MIIIKTKFGNAKINHDSYYVITSNSNKNINKRLHRLIFEDFYSKLFGYNYKIPKGYIIHHIDGDKLNNCILNLELMSWSKHNKIHHLGVKRSLDICDKYKLIRKGKFHSDETKLKMSKSKNTTGYYRVCKCRDDRCKQGFRYFYSYMNQSIRKSISSVSLEKLEKKVKNKGLEWRKL